MRRSLIGSTKSVLGRMIMNSETNSVLGRKDEREQIRARERIREIS